MHETTLRPHPGVQTRPHAAPKRCAWPLPRGTAVRMVPGTGCQDPRRDRRAVLGGWGLRPPADCERRIARRLLRCLRLAGTRPGQIRRGEGRPGSGQAHPAQVRRAGVALPSPRGVHDHRGPRTVAARCARSHAQQRLGGRRAGHSAAHGWPSSARTARASFDRPRETCCVNLTAWPGRMSRKRARYCASSSPP